MQFPDAVFYQVGQKAKAEEKIIYVNLNYGNIIA